MIEVKVKYFGEVAEQAQREDEVVRLENNNVSTLLEYLNTNYSIDVAGIKIAINQELVSNADTFNATDELAILSQFAGG